MSTTTTKKKKPTFEEDKERAEKLMAAYAELKQELDAKSKDFNDGITAIKTSLTAAEEELTIIGKRHKKKFTDKKLQLTDGYLLLSEETQVKELEGFSWSKFIRLFPSYAKATFVVKELKQAFSDGDRRPKIMEKGKIDLYQEKTIKVKLNKVTDEEAQAS